MAYSTISKPSLNFNTKLYTGNGSNGHSITGVGFQPDWTWIKSRTSTHNNQSFDAVRGVQKSYVINEANAEFTMTNGLTAFGTDGFTVGSDDQVNNNSQNYASWNWKAGNSAGSTNNDGNITSTVSANTTAGFSICSWTGTGSAGTIGHGLGAKPDFIIFKNRTQGENSMVWHKNFTNQQFCVLDTTAASVTNYVTVMNNTAPTNQVIYLGNGDTRSNYSGHNYVAYCFAGKTGYSKFGSYTGNGNADGTFVYTGFKPAFILAKITDGVSGWNLFDNKRIGYNDGNYWLVASVSDAEHANTGGMFDLLSNGFKIRSSYGSRNTSGGTYIYMAFAEEPLVANVGSSIPATAR